jgi:hypothetical protein
MINNKLWTLDKQNIQYSYDFVVFCCVGLALALPKKDKIDPWRLAVSGPFALGPFTLQVGLFALIIKNDIGSL